MPTDLLLVLIFLGIAIALFALNKPRMDAVALIMLTGLPLTGVISMNDALAGFSDPNVVLIAALFVLGDGLVRTGVARAVGDWLTARAGQNHTLLLVLLMSLVAALGATMSSTAVTAIFIPVVMRIARSTKTSPSRLLMPLSFAALISGMLTLIATAPNLVVNSELERYGAAGFSFFSFTPIGIPILVLGICYMTIAQRWITDRHDRHGVSARRPTLSEWIERYQLGDREYRVRVTSHSSLVGRVLSELNLRAVAGANIIAIERSRRLSSTLLRPSATTELQVDDVLLVDMFDPDREIQPLLERFALELLPLTGAYFSDLTQEIGMVEVILPAESTLVHKTVVESQFRTRFGLTVVGLRRGDSAIERGPHLHRLRAGDTLLLVGPWKDIQRLRTEEEGDLVVLQLPAELEEVLPVGGRAPFAIFCLVLVVALMVSQRIPNVQAALIGCLLMGASGCINLRSAYRAIDWKTIVLVVGMLPFSVALNRTGGNELAATALMKLVDGTSIHIVMAMLFAITAILGMFISNTATAVLMGPVAIAVAGELQASPHPFAMIVALAASSAFMTPVASPVNTLVVTPGNYRFSDFVRIGAPFVLIVMLVSVFLVPLLFPP